MNSDTQEKMYDIMYYLLEAVPGSNQLFLRWTELTAEEKDDLDENVLKSIKKKDESIYTPIIQAFVQWDHLQDTEGAPGFVPGYKEYKYDEDMERKIAKVMRALEKGLDNLDFKKGFKHEEKTTDPSDVNQFDYNQIRQGKSLTELGKKGAPTNKKKPVHSKNRRLKSSQSSTNLEED